MAAALLCGVAAGQTAPPPPAAKKAAAPPPSVIAGIPVNYDESAVGTYTLPDPLVMQNGTRVRDAKIWTEKRRPEIVRLFEENEYGRAPGTPRDMSFDVFDKGTPAYDGKAIRKQVTIYFSADKNGPREDLVVYVPANARQGGAAAAVHQFFPQRLQLRRSRNPRRRNVERAREEESARARAPAVSAASTWKRSSRTASAWPESITATSIPISSAASRSACAPSTSRPGRPSPRRMSGAPSRPGPGA